MNPLKIRKWSGKNKTRVRLLKAREIEKLINEDKEYFDRPEGWQPYYLTFSGAEAYLERMLVARELISDDNIITIQTYEKLGSHHDGKGLLDKLIKTRNKHLKHMRIWPYNFHSFAEKYTADGCQPPSECKTAGWNTPPYRKYMQQLVSDDPVKFSVLDLDFCGIFNRRNSESVVKLFENKVLEKSGVMFITHQKGRDIRGGELFDILYSYMCQTKLINFKSIIDFYGGKLSPDVARYMLIPLYYICKAYENGYTLELTRRIEYRDLGKTNQAAVKMIQYFFKWHSLDVWDDHELASRSFRQDVIDEDYPTHSWVE